MPTTIISPPSFDKQGHRGCRGLLPENTVPAMIRALELGITTLELDLVITADKQVVLSHEPFFNHEISTKPDGQPVTEAEERSLNIYRMPAAEVQRYDVGLKPHPRFPRQEKRAVRKPLLDEVFTGVEAWLKEKGGRPVFYNMEIKSDPGTDGQYHPAPAEFVALVMQVVERHRMQDRMILQSFDIRTLQEVRRTHPSVRTALLVEDFDKRTLEEQLARLGFVPSVYSPHYSLVTDTLVRDCHAKGMQLIPWTVNDKASIDRLRQLGVDGIITDYPDLFHE
jgi:glycerophosphoryl diester phosphodiesterase